MIQVTLKIVSGGKFPFWYTLQLSCGGKYGINFFDIYKTKFDTENYVTLKIIFKVFK